MANRPDIFAFIYLNHAIPKTATNHGKYLVSVATIESRTGLDFLQKLPAADYATVDQAAVEDLKAKAIWK